MKTPEQHHTLELWPGQWSEVIQPSYLIDVAQILSTEVNRPEVREWIEASPMHVNQYTQLRHLLLILKKSKVAGPRRLTWWERITGRVQA